VNNPDLDARLEQLAALGEPARRALYRYVAGQADAVGREQAAAGVGVAFHVAKFHLDRLVDDGLLIAEYRRPPGRGGPGAGRPAKVYRPAHELDVSIPERRYDLAGRLLVRAVASANTTGDQVSDRLADEARLAGRDMARGISSEMRGSSPAGRLVAVLSSCGFEPDATDHAIVLRNCPFHRLVEEERDVVCGMNLSFVTGLLEGAGAKDASATLDPQSRGCCVRIATGSGGSD
jgi:predicted ArsR family transcriptional regulator